MEQIFAEAYRNACVLHAAEPFAVFPSDCVNQPKRRKQNLAPKAAFRRVVRQENPSEKVCYYTLLPLLRDKGINIVKNFVGYAVFDAVCPDIQPQRKKITFIFHF